MKLVHLVSMSILTSIKNIQFSTKLNGAHGATISSAKNEGHQQFVPYQCQLINNNYCKLLLFHAIIPTLPVRGEWGLESP